MTSPSEAKQPRLDGSIQRQKINDFIIGFYAEHGAQPVIRDISRHLGRTNNCVVGHLMRMTATGDIIRVETGGNPKYVPAKLVQAIKNAARSLVKENK